MDATEVHIKYIRESLDEIKGGVSDLKDSFGEMNGRVRTNQVDIANIKGKASTAGVISGAVSGILAATAAVFGINQ